MELRSDIAAAATHMTSGYEVHREIRQLGAYLREGESVQRLASGIYGAGAGLLAVTDHRVLLLRDGRSGQASEGFPLGRLSVVDWVADGAQGNITVSDSNTTAELRDVPAAEGAEIVAYIRSVTDPEANIPPARRWSSFGSQPGPGPGRPSQTGPLGHVPGEDRAPTRTGPSFRDEVPTQKIGVERTGSIGGPRRVAARHADTYPTPAQYAPTSNPGALTRGAVPISLLARTTAIPSQQPSVEPPAAALPVEQPSVERSGQHERSVEGSGQHERAVERSGQHERTVERSGQHERTVERSGAVAGPELMAGEVPISLLAAEASQGLAPVDAPDQEADGEMTAAVPRTEAGHSDAGIEGTGGDRPVPISWTAPAQSGANRAAQAESTVGMRSPIRVEATSPPLVSAGSGPSRGSRSKKWIWLGAGAAGLIGLAALGSAKLISTGQPMAAPVNPAPAAVDSAVGPVVTVTKVIDGDTVEVTGAVNGVVEVLGIVAPRVDKEQCGAATAKAFAVKTLNNATVTLVADPSQPATDRAGNRLAFLRLPNGADYSVLAVQAGMARYYESPEPVGTAADIKAAEAQAEKQHTGLWAAPCYGRFTTPTSTGTTTGTGASTTSEAGSTGTAHSSGSTSTARQSSSRSNGTASEGTSGSGNG
jgi:endonuclease YncB( thermonuclease family)